MKISELKSSLVGLNEISFLLPDKTMVPAHFHVTEVGRVEKQFVDCGGVVRTETVANLQLWNANDYNHRLHPQKLVDILTLADNKFQLNDLHVEVEYQGDTIGKFGLEFDGSSFLLTSKRTACLALDDCGISDKMVDLSSSLSAVISGSCTPDSGCCN